MVEVERIELTSFYSKNLADFLNFTKPNSAKRTKVETSAPPLTYNTTISIALKVRIMINESKNFRDQRPI